MPPDKDHEEETVDPQPLSQGTWAFILVSLVAFTCCGLPLVIIVGGSGLLLFIGQNLYSFLLAGALVVVGVLIFSVKRRKENNSKCNC
jgi:LPXTG-motif cell wall-anchored protein